MIHFFRRIRQKLLTNNQIRKYVLYALGEILLVVVGILLALQINNWNEARKDAADEAHILHEILNNLEEDSNQLTHIADRRKKAQVGVVNMLQSLNETPANPVDPMDFAAFITFERYYPVRNAFEMMKSTALKISNHKLGSSISRYYDYEQKNVSRSVEDIEQVFMRIFQSENAIRSNLKRANAGTIENLQVELHNSNESKFKQLLREELIAFRDNNSTTLDKIIAFVGINSELTEEIARELQTRRLSKYLNQD